jgi:hypothetical protein
MGDHIDDAASKAAEKPLLSHGFTRMHTDKAFLSIPVHPRASVAHTSGGPFQHPLRRYLRGVVLTGNAPRKAGLLNRTVASRFVFSTHSP